MESTYRSCVHERDPTRSQRKFLDDGRPRASGEPVQRSTLPPVLATPLMILFMENAALSAIRDYLAPGESALGTVVNVRHLAATPVGQRVTAEAIVTSVEGRRIVFAVTARDETQEIGSGIHERALVDLGRLAQRLDAKQDQKAANRQG